MSMDKTRVFFSFHVPVSSGERILHDLASFPVERYPAENLHVTLRFVGDVFSHEQEQLIAGAERIIREHPPIIFKPLNFDLENGRMRLYVEGGQPLTLLHSHLVQVMRELHIGKADSRPYRPHITLARTNDSLTLPSSHTAYSFKKNTFGLYRSEQGEKRMGVYTLLHDFPLQG